MAWFQRKDKGIQTPTEAKKEAPDGLWYKTPSGKIVHIRELKNIIERAVVESNGMDIMPHHLHFFRSRRQVPSVETPEHTQANPVEEFPLNLKEAEVILIERALERTQGNITAAAKLLGTHRPRIYKYLKAQGRPAQSQ